MKIVYDLDGVFRNLSEYLELRLKVPLSLMLETQGWHWTYEGKNIFEWIENDDYRALVYAPAMPYLVIAEKLAAGEPLELWTCQPPKWRPYTNIWIGANFKTPPVVRYLNTEEKRARLDRERDTILVEDCPLFKSYERIVLIDWPYNRKIQAERIHNREELKRCLKVCISSPLPEREKPSAPVIS